MSASGRRWPYTAALAAVALAFVLPMLWLFSVSLKTKAGVYAFPPQWLPGDASLGNYAFVLGRTEVVSLFMYRAAFASMEAGRAAAVAVILLVLNLGLAFVAARLIQRGGKAA